MKFEDYNLAPELTNGIRKLGFKRPTDIQYKTIPSILDGEDVLAVAQTGTGKRLLLLFLLYIYCIKID